MYVSLCVSRSGRTLMMAPVSSALLQYDKDYKKDKPIEVDDNSRESTWFASGLPREIVRSMVASMLTDGKPGEFIVRDKASIAGAFAISVKEKENALLTFLIEKRGLKLTIRGTDEKFMTLFELIQVFHHETVVRTPVVVVSRSAEHCHDMHVTRPVLCQGGAAHAGDTAAHARGLCNRGGKDGEG